MADLIDIKLARSAAKRLARNRDFGLVLGYLGKKARHGKSPFSAVSPEDTARRIGRQEQHQLLVDLVMGKQTEDDNA
jgi:hypothetical protein